MTTVAKEAERQGYYTWLPEGDTRPMILEAWFNGSLSHEEWSYHPLNSALNKDLSLKKKKYSCGTGDIKYIKYIPSPTTVEHLSGVPEALFNPQHYTEIHQ
jgi:hypothetical protein